MNTTEIYIVELIGQGKANKEIASLVHKPKRTVDDIIHRMLLKLKCRNRAQLVAKMKDQVPRFPV